MNPLVDLSKFKRVSSDGKTSTLVHPKGHEIKVAHGGLTQKMRAQINLMPLHFGVGGGVEIGETEEAPAQDQPENKTTAPAEALDQQVYPTTGEGSPAVPAAAPVATPGQPPPMIPAVGTDPQSLYQEQIARAQDMASKKIDPETVGSMFGKKDTVGKIGTLFGLMLSGAGSGLAHQNNMLMDMMNKELDRDLDAQKSSKAGAQNFLNAEYGHALQNAQADYYNNKTQREYFESIPQIAGALNYAQKKNITGITLPTLQDYIDAHNAAAHHMASGTAGLAAAQIIVDKANASGNQQAINGAANLQQGAVQRAQQKSVDASNAAQSVLNKKSVPLAQQKDPITGLAAVVDQNKLEAARMQGADDLAYSPTKTVQTGSIDPSPAMKETLSKEQAELSKDRAVRQTYLKNYQELYNLPNAGQNPAARLGSTAAAAAATAISGAVGGLGGAYAAGKISDNLQGMSQELFERKRNQFLVPIMERLLPAGASDEAKKKLADAIFPNWTDDAKSVITARDQGLKNFQENEAKIAPNLSTYASQIPGLVAPLPEAPPLILKKEDQNRGPSSPSKKQSTPTQPALPSKDKDEKSWWGEKVGPGHW